MSPGHGTKSNRGSEESPWEELPSISTGLSQTAADHSQSKNTRTKGRRVAHLDNREKISGGGRKKWRSKRRR